MKVTFEFDTDNEDQRADLKIMQQAKDLHLAMWEFSQTTLRKARKHGELNGKVLEESQTEVAEQIEQEFYNCLRECGVDLDV